MGLFCTSVIFNVFFTEFYRFFLPGFLPAFTGRWIDPTNENPVDFLILFLFLLLLFFFGSLSSIDFVILIPRPEGAWLQPAARRLFFFYFLLLSLFSFLFFFSFTIRNAAFDSSQLISRWHGISHQRSFVNNRNPNPSQWTGNNNNNNNNNNISKIDSMER